MAKLKIGESPRRVEDARFITGSGCYIDDLRPAGMVHAVIVRSPHAHADLLGIDTGPASSLPGVLGILTGRDLDAAGIGPLEPSEQVNVYSGEAFRYPTQYVLAKDRVRYVGEPVALVIAETRNLAMDAAEAIVADYRALPPVTDIKQAIAADRKELICLEWHAGDDSAVSDAFSAAAHVSKIELHNHRIATNAMEPRGAIGIYDPQSGQYTLHISTQSLHAVRDRTATTLGVDPGKVRFVAPDVGGGFGVKNFPYPEMVLICWAARVAGRPVKWIASRTEGFVSDHQARDNDSSAELALDHAGNFTALRVWSRGNLGAYLTGSMARIYTEQFVKLPGGPYRIPAVHVDVGAVYTNTVPTGVTRGPGFAEFATVMERLIDRAASETGRDPAALRCQNLVAPREMPYTNAVGAVIDSGDFAKNVQTAMASAQDGFEERKAVSQAGGRLRGIGIGYHMKATFGAPDENVELRFDDDGKITFTTGTQAIGQGHETSFPQIISHLLGIPAEDIHYRAGDTDLIAFGGGHGSSRATFMAGTAIFMAVEVIKEKGRRIAASMLEASEADLEFADGAFGIAGTDRNVGLMEVAAKAREIGDPLDTYQHFTREHHTFPNGCHVAEVEVDPDTGVSRLVRYTAVDDYGTVVNPLLVHGQMHGAIAQGVGQALMEHAVFDQSSGQLLAGSFMDYAMPRADDLPSFEVSLAGIPCTTNPLGVKGAGEAGAIAGFPAVTNALINALQPLGIEDIQGPATPQRVWQLIQAAKAGN